MPFPSPPWEKANVSSEAVDETSSPSLCTSQLFPFRIRYAHSQPRRAARPSPQPPAAASFRFQSSDGSCLETCHRSGTCRGCRAYWALLCACLTPAPLPGVRGPCRVASWGSSVEGEKGKVAVLSSLCGGWLPPWIPVSLCFPPWVWELDTHNNAVSWALIALEFLHTFFIGKVSRVFHTIVIWQPGVVISLGGQLETKKTEARRR